MCSILVHYGMCKHTIIYQNWARVEAMVALGIGLSPVWHQTITWINDDILSIRQSDLLNLEPESSFLF